MGQNSTENQAKDKPEKGGWWARITGKNNTPEEDDSPTLYQWTDKTRLDDLEKLYQETHKNAKRRIGWYTKNSRQKKGRAQSIRISALVLFGIGAIIPVIIDLIGVYFESVSIPASLATLFLALATGLIAFDRYMGYSTGWMRFISSELKLKFILEKFEYDWQNERVGWDNSTPTIEHAKTMLLRCGSLRQEISQVVQDETQSWMQEFQSNLQNLDENFKVVTETTKSGALELVVEHGETYPKGWTLYIDGQSKGLHTGNTAALKNVSPGFYEVKIEPIGEKGDLLNVYMGILQVEANKVTHRTVTLKEHKKEEAALDEN